MDLTHAEKITLSKFLKRGIPYNIAIKAIKNIELTIPEGKLFPQGSKKKVKFICFICNKKSICSIKNISKRLNGLAWELICNNCIPKASCNTIEHIKNNSKAQKIAQNKSETKEKQRIAQKIAHDNDPTLSKRKAEIGLKYANSEEALKRRVKKFRERYENDEEFRNKLRPRGFVSGEINNIQFDSSYELRYLLFCIKNKQKIKREPFRIPYGTKIYKPDFLIDDKYLIEIKGYISKDKITEKKKIAAIEYCKGKNIEYKILFKQNLKELGAWEINWEIYNRQEILLVKNNATIKWLKKYKEKIIKAQFMTLKY